MMKIAKEVEDIKKRPWFKRLDAEDQKIALAKMTEPAPEPERSEMKVRSHSQANNEAEPIWYITTTFKAANIDKIKDNQIVQAELKEQITRICREHGISKMVIHFEEQEGGGGRPVIPSTPAPTQS